MSPGRTGGPLTRALVALALAGGANGCGSPSPSDGEAVKIGVLLSYSGFLAANSINSERALWMAVEAANAAGGVGGRKVALIARDTRSNPTRVTPPARELLDAGAALFIGPDTRELAVQLKDLLQDHTLIMPSFTTSDTTQYKPSSWFLMGAPPARVACELAAQLRADRRRNPVVIADPNGYSTYLSFELTKAYGFPEIVLPADATANETTTVAITAAHADAYVLAALPRSASSLLYSLAAIGALKDASGWYLSPTLHTPALLETLPKGMLVGARGVATGTMAGAGDFRRVFGERWQDKPLDDAYPFYDAGAVAVLALQRALHLEGAIPTGTGLGKHIVAVTHSAGTPVRWNELARGLELLRQGQEVGYIGLSGPLQFDLTGQAAGHSTNWWTVAAQGFADIPSQSNCR